MLYCMILNSAALTLFISYFFPSFLLFSLSSMAVSVQMVFFVLCRTASVYFWLSFPETDTECLLPCQAVKEHCFQPEMPRRGGDVSFSSQPQ